MTGDHAHECYDGYMLPSRTRASQRHNKSKFECIRCMIDILWSRSRRYLLYIKPGQLAGEGVLARQDREGLEHKIVLPCTSLVPRPAPRPAG